MNDVLVIVGTSVFTGLVSTLGTVAALRVHIIYLREHIGRHEKTIERAHSRIDELLDRMNVHE